MNPTMSIKHGVVLDQLTPQAVLAMSVTASILSKHSYDFVVTSCGDGKHMAGSLHYSGRAFDFRTNKIHESMRSRIFTDIREALGPEFDVVMEKTHGHVEWDPQYLKQKRG